MGESMAQLVIGNQFLDVDMIFTINDFTMVSCSEDWIHDVPRRHRACILKNLEFVFDVWLISPYRFESSFNTTQLLLLEPTLIPNA